MISVKGVYEFYLIHMGNIRALFLSVLSFQE